MAEPQHFEGVSGTYADARPPYPDALFDHLRRAGVIGPVIRVLEIGAGTGQATIALAKAGCVITAVGPGARLAEHLAATAPDTTVVNARAEDIDLPNSEFDTIIAATAMHWVDLPTMLPRLHRALVPSGRLAVWRTVFGDPRVRTPFRDGVARIVEQRPPPPRRRDPLDPPPTVRQLETGGWFAHEETWTLPWHVDMTPEQVHALFRTFSDWSDDELSLLADAASAHRPTIREHYVTHLHLLHKT